VAPFSRAGFQRAERLQNILCPRLHLSILDRLNGPLCRHSSSGPTSTSATALDLLLGFSSSPSQPVGVEQRYRHSTRLYTSTYRSILTFS